MADRTLPGLGYTGPLTPRQPPHSPNRSLRRLHVLVLAMASLGSSLVSAQPTDRYEPGGLPILAQDADVGVMLGGFAQLARFRDDRRPYAWRLQTLAIVSFREGATGTEMPYRETFVRFDRPSIWGQALRLQVQLGYSRTTNLGYFGIGNATPAEASWQSLPEGSPEYVQRRRYYQFDGVTPNGRLAVRLRLAPTWEITWEGALQWVDVRVYDGSLLGRDLAMEGGPGFSLGEGWQPRAAMGLVHDSRDHETVPTQGQYHDGSVRCGGRTRDDAYCGLNLTLRAYRALWGQYLSLAGRFLGDLQLGNPSLIELSRYGGIESGTGPGGSRGIRGVPQGRLAGKGKVIANLELRSFFLAFSLGSQRFELGGAAFADAGRVWASSSTSVQDGSFRLHWGVGAGPRVRWGDALLIRADVAYAPLGASLGAAPAVYVTFDMVM